MNNPPTISDSQERNMARFHAFQAETLRLHAHYLEGQLAYTGALLQEAQLRFNAPAPEALGERDVAVACLPVLLKPLPAPDRLLCDFPKDAVCIVTDDGTPNTLAIAKTLQRLGCSVVVLSLPLAVVSERASLPNDIPRIALEGLDEMHLVDQLPANTGGLIYLHPYFTADPNGALCASEKEKSLIKHVFLLAKHLKQSLNGAAQAGRSFFITLTRLNGRLGLGEEINTSPCAGGLFGLTKSLKHEWPAVFCRALDMNPQFDPETVARLLVAELYDPDVQLGEVGWDMDGRYTLAVDIEPR